MELPPEIILKIFGYLPVYDAIQLKLVCKQWYQLAASLKQHSLVLHSKALIEDDLFAKPLKGPDWVQYKDEDLLLANPLPPMLNRVRKLSAYFCSDLIVDVSKFYNQFERLEELTCHHLYHLIHPVITLNLAHLRKLTTGDDFTHRFELHTPSLVHLEVYSLFAAFLHFPEKLKRLQASLHDFHLVDFDKLINLEVLIVTGSDWSSIRDLIINSFLATHKNLKEIHFRFDLLHNGGQLLDATYRRPGLKLYASGFDIDQRLEVVIEEKFPHGSEEDVSRFLARNYEKAAQTVYFPLRVEFNELARNGLETILPARFPRLLAVKTDGRVEDENALLKFLVETNPSKFLMANQLLSQTLLTQLGCTSIQKMEFKNLNLDIACPEFHFIFKMNNLSHLKIDQRICFDFLVQAFERCEGLTAVEFEANRCYGGFRCTFLFLRSGTNNFLQEFGAYLRSQDKAELCYFLRHLRRQVKLDPKLENIRELIYWIQNYKNNFRLVKSEVTKLIRNEVFHIYCS